MSFTPQPTILTHLLNFTIKTIALLAMTVLPAFVTTLPPVAASSLSFQRVEGRVIAKAQRYMFFVIPYRTEIIDPVVEIGSDSKQGSVTREKRTGAPDHYQKADNQGFLVVKGPASSSQPIPADYHKLDSLKSQVKTFLQDPQAQTLNLYLLGNPLFSIVFGGGSTALFLLITVCFIIAGVQWVLKKLGLVKPKQRRPKGLV